MVDLNNFSATGRLVTGFEKKGNGFYTARIAVQDDYRDKDGKWVDSASFFDINISRNFQKEENEKAFLARFDKGTRVAISGSLRQRVSEGKDGKKYYNITVVINTIASLEQKAKAAAAEDDEDVEPF